MPHRINKIEMVCFRGATRKNSLTFDDKKPIVFLFGENGTGKSTIIDAIDLVANLSIGSLKNRSLGTTNKTTYLPAAGKSTAKMVVRIEADGKAWKATVDSSGVHRAPPKYVPDVRILRRADLMKLVEAKPADRYHVLKQFIDVAEIERCENALRDEHRAQKTDHDNATSILADALHTLDELWEKEGKPEDTAEKWAETKEGADQSVLQARVTSLNALLQKITGLASRIESYTSAADGVSKAESAAAETESELSEAPAVAGKTAVDLIQLLQRAQSYLDKTTDLKVCPVCEQTVDQEDLKASIANRISGMSTHQGLATKRTEGKQLIERAKGVWDSAVQDLLNSLQDLADVTEEEPLAKDFREKKLLPAAADLKKDATSAIETIKALVPELDTFRTNRQVKFDTIQADINKYNGIVTNLARVRENREKAEQLEVLIARLKSALVICEKERKAFTQEILDEVADEIGRLFKELHPHEPIGDPKLELKRRASIDQSVRFGDQTGVPPQAYYSDSHLDTLGFCVWLALAKRGDSSDRIVVFDDLFTSIDSAHHDRILKLIVTEADVFAQTFLTTHSRSLFNRPRKLAAASGKMDLKELHRWSLARGIAATTRLIFIDEIEALLKTAPLSRQEISSQAGILLESVLDDLCEQYGRRLPRNKANEYTLGALLDGCKKLVEILQRKVDGDSGSTLVDGRGPIQVAYEKLREIDFIRNMVGCHHNPLGDEIADAEVENFGRHTIDLVSELICPECKEVPWRRDLSHFSCSCKKTRLKPLEFTK